METFKISGDLRTSVGKKSSKLIRAKGDVPCVLYGGEKTIHFSSPELSFKKIVYTQNAYLVKLYIDGKEYNALLQDIQFHPVTDRIIHVDFKEISFDKEVITHLPVKVIGDSVGIKKGGKISQKRRKLKVKALPLNLPDFVEVDITDLDIGESIKVGELVIENLTMLDPHRSMIIAVVSSRLSKGMEAGEEELEAAAEAAAAADAAETEAEGTETETTTE
jgi:large subunit ribosomal protein L25